MRKFSQSFTNWPLSDNYTIMIDRINAHGDSVEELLENCEIFFGNWKGETGPTWCLKDLSAQDYKKIERLFTQFLLRGGECL